ncbi:27851_t:CDS:2, partial [Racocetra persica]
MVKLLKCSGIVQVNAKATRYLDSLDVWHIEVAGPFDNTTNDHIINDTRKSLCTDLLNLIIILRNHLDCDVNTTIKIKMFCIQTIKTRLTLYALNMLSNGYFFSSELISVDISFSFNGKSQYKSILRMMAIFHDEIAKQVMLMDEINKCVLRSNRTTVCATQYLQSSFGIVSLDYEIM